MAEPSTIHLRVSEVRSGPRLIAHPLVLSVVVLCALVISVLSLRTRWPVDVTGLGRTPWELLIALLSGVVAGLVLTWVHYRRGQQPIIRATVMIRPARLMTMGEYLIIVGPGLAIQIGVWVLVGIARSSQAVNLVYVSGFLLGLLPVLPLYRRAWHGSCLVVRKANAARQARS